MLYLVTGTHPPALALVAAAGDRPPTGHGLGYICQPDSNTPPDRGWWAADNGCFTTGDRFDPQRWLRWLERWVDATPRALFAVLPDVPFNHQATLARSLPWAQRARDLGYPAAFAAQNGATVDTMPWDDLDVVFLAGDTPWKVGHHAWTITTEARARGKWVHMGRVNSESRLRHAARMGCDSVDGTFQNYAPEENLGRLLRWFDGLTGRPVAVEESPGEQLDLLGEAS